MTDKNLKKYDTLGRGLKFLEKKYKPKKTFTSGVRKIGSKISKKGRGRPKKSYEHRHPITGQPIRAQDYYKVKRNLKNRAQRMVEQRKVRTQLAMARRGIPPQVAQQIQQARLIRQARAAIVSPIQTQPQIRQPIRRVIPQQQRFRVVTNLMTGRKTIQPIQQKERWLR